MYDFKCFCLKLGLLIRLISYSPTYIIPTPTQVKSSQLYLGRVALSAIGWYQKGPCVNYDYTIKIKNYFKIMYEDFKK